MPSLHLEIISRAALPTAVDAAIEALCTRAYEEDFTDAFALFPGTTHVLGYQGTELVSHAAWMPRQLLYHGQPLRAAYIEAVATEPRYQGRGYASAVLRHLAAAVAADPASYELAALAPSDPAFYARLGWESWHGPLLETTPAGVVQPSDPDETVMVLRLPRTPAELDLQASLTAPWRPGDIW